MTTLSIPDMTCGHCKASVESALKSLADAGDITVDLAAKTATTTGPAAPARLLKALDEVGFPATVIA
ncbi:heavy-metal-associated domain-containing protein [Rhodobacteraceae bacterium HSP-20]|uniref:Heavy-metal-associated domain-containing protein n=1 Tax=Paragemmobacter amnigenus TaxID=2852097 RepID=A0ABS6J6Q2_9RHOB|nr:heavy metal-associated domain-containing protein [Rhodobacter amnigenus]MBU9699441.1 heavy-metal-associated domain-containing protein [Rhodobacter amnigenus]MBV4390668.1 heavy-metal-associated domain-containing protein [Rhodobacter amnigenus]